MSVYSVGLDPSSGKSSLTKDKFSYTKTYKVLSNNFADDEVFIAAAAGLPIMYSQHPEFPFARVQSISPHRQTPNACVWLVDITWETPGNKDNDDKQEQHQDPKSEVPIITWTFENYQVAAVESDNPFKSPFVNSANEPFDPQPQMDLARVIIQIKKNYDPGSGVEQLAMAYANSINSDAFWGGIFPPHSVKCQPPVIRGPLQRQTQGGGSPVYYLEVVWTFACLPNSVYWDITALDQGTYYIPGGIGVGDAAVNFTTADGHPYVGLLDGNGGASNAEDPSAATPKYLPRKQIYFEGNFGALGLPQSFSAVIPPA